MSMFHQHQWVEVRRSFSQSGRAFTAEGAGDNLFLYSMFGCTSVEQRCSGCGDLRCNLLVGKLDAEAK